MLNIKDVAKYILVKFEEINSWKLHKLCYYCQVYYYINENTPLFYNVITAWLNGPVILDLYKICGGKNTLNANDIDGNINNIGIIEKHYIDLVIKKYGQLSNDRVNYPHLTPSELEVGACKSSS